MNLRNITKREIEDIKLRYFNDEIKLDECHKETGYSKNYLKHLKWKYKSKNKEK